jgi:hypothetical protein
MITFTFRTGPSRWDVLQDSIALAEVKTTNGTPRARVRRPLNPDQLASVLKLMRFVKKHPTAV